MSWMNYMSIYEDDINNGIDTAEKALNQLELSNYNDELHREAFEELKEIGDWDHITNSIIAAYFRIAQSIIERELPDVDTDYFVNCTDSHFYIGQEEVY